MHFFLGGGWVFSGGGEFGILGGVNPPGYSWN